MMMLLPSGIGIFKHHLLLDATSSGTTYPAVAYALNHTRYRLHHPQSSQADFYDCPILQRLLPLPAIDKAVTGRV